MNDLNRLKEMTHLIEDMTDGRQRVQYCDRLGVNVYCGPEAYTEIYMRKQPEADTGNIRLSFTGSIRRAGTDMSPGEFQQVAGEIQETGNLLYELEQAAVTVTPEEMQEWAGWLTDRQLVQEQQMEMDEPAPGLEMY